MASSPLMKWLFGRNSRSASLAPSPRQASSHDFALPQRHRFSDQLEPPRVPQYQFLGSPLELDGLVTPSAPAPAPSASSPPPPVSPQVEVAQPSAWADGVSSWNGAGPASPIQPARPPAADPESPAESQYIHQPISDVDEDDESAIIMSYTDHIVPSLLNVMPPVRVQAFQVPTPTQEVFGQRPPRLPILPSPSAEQINDASDPQQNSAMPPGSPTGHNLSAVSLKPTCSLNLVCYRSGASGCKLHQVLVAKQSRYKDEKKFMAACKANPHLIVTDEQFFHALREGYLKTMCGFWRRVFFLKTLRGLRLLTYKQDSRPTVVPLDTFVLQEILYAYNHPSRISTEHLWIDWVFQLRQPSKRHALEFVEGWNGARIAIAGTIPLVLSALVGLIWSVRSGDWQTAFTVASFILTAGTLLLALLAVVSGIEASGRAAAL